MFGKSKKSVSLHIVEDSCTGCGLCVYRCRHGVFNLKFKDQGLCAFPAYPEFCSACGKCEKKCPNGAIIIS